MSVIGSNILAGASGQGGDYTIARSLRFRSSASAYLSRTVGTASNRKTWTWSGWVKRGVLGVQQGIFGSNNGSTYPRTNLYFTASDTLNYFDEDAAGANIGVFQTTQVFRDPSAYYHIVFAIDTTQATSTNRVKIYVNGVQVTSFTTATYPTLDFQGQINNTSYPQTIGRTNGGEYLDGYITEVNFIDGQALTPSSFGATNASTGVWQPKKYAGTYGTNGFYLPFTDNSGATSTTIGKDFSGNSNNWTPNNISVTAGSTYDSMTDVPTLTSATAANFCVMNPLAKNSSLTVQDGNLYCTSASTNVGASGTIGVSSGKWYWEVTRATGTTGQPMVGIVKSGWDLSYVGGFAGGYAYDAGGNKYNNEVPVAYGATYTAGDVIGIALDLTAGTITFYKNNTSQGVAFSGLSGEFFPALSVQNNAFAVNFGQRPFAYTPPTGFVALNTFNLPTPTIGATASTQAGKYFNTVLYTGTGIDPLAITGVGFQPDMVWIKSRSNALAHNIYDAVRGVSKRLQTNLTNAESSPISGVKSFDTNGFTLGNDTDDTNFTSGNTYVSWNWKANGTGVSNTAGSITSTVSANTSAGFSVVTYTGNGSAGATVGHGLGVKPSMMIIKSRGGVRNWIVYSSVLTATSYLRLNTTDATVTTSSPFNNTEPNSTVFTLGTGSFVNTASEDFVAYCFAEVAGYSKFGSYTGNGSTDGVFVYCGFRPKYIMVKQSSGSGQGWLIEDTARDTYNVAGLDLAANSSGAEANDTPVMDILSNGFKMRNTYGGFNTSGATYIVMAFAETPFKYANAR